jgi:hypothetical protein
MENKLAIFTQEIKKIKLNYGSGYFEKSGLCAVLGDLAPNVDKKFISVLKKADEVSLPQKLVKTKEGNNALIPIHISNLRQDFKENTGLDATLASVVFDSYLFGLDLKQDFDLKDYEVPESNNGLQIESLIELALADGRLERNEIKSIYYKASSLGIDEEEVFKLFKINIHKFKLHPLSSGSIDLNSTEVLLKYDWVDWEIIKYEKKIITYSENDEEREKQRLSAIQREQTLSAQKEKKLEIKRIELELKKKEQEAKEKEELRKIELDKQKEIQLKKQQRREKRNQIWQWLTTAKNVKNGSPLLWITVILVLGGITFWAFSKSADKDLKEQEAQEFSVELEKKYTRIENYILLGQIDSTLFLLPEIEHPSNERSPFKPHGILSDHYTYKEYWKIKKEELKLRIESSLNSKKEPKPSAKSQQQAPMVSENELDNNSLTPWEEMSISEEDYYQMVEDGYIEREFEDSPLILYKISDPDGYSNLRKTPGGEIIRKVFENEYFEVIGEESNHKNVIFTSGQVGYIHNSRVVKK